MSILIVKDYLKMSIIWLKFEICSHAKDRSQRSVLSRCNKAKALISLKASKFRKVGQNLNNLTSRPRCPSPCKDTEQNKPMLPTTLYSML